MFDPEEALRLMADHRVRNTFIPPTALRMLRNVQNPRGRFDLALRTIGSGGEALGARLSPGGARRWASPSTNSTGRRSAISCSPPAGRSAS